MFIAKFPNRKSILAMNVIKQKSPANSPFLEQISFRGIIGCRRWGRVVMDTITNVAQLVGIMGLMPCDTTFFVSLQGDANDHPVFHPDYAALSSGPHHHSRGL